LTGSCVDCQKIEQAIKMGKIECSVMDSKNDER